METEALERLPRTPMWDQYKEVKRQALQSLLFYRMGDFYELFLDDAVEASRILGITLTARAKDESNPVPMCGVPFHSATRYINRLLGAGKRVAICEQTSDPATTKGIVKREIVRIVSPGIVLDQDEIEAGRQNWLLALAPSPERPNTGSFCALDSSTGEILYGCWDSPEDLQGEMAILQPREILARESLVGSAEWNRLVQTVGEEYFPCVTPTPDFHFHPGTAAEDLCRHFGVMNLEGFGLSAASPELGSIGAAWRLLRDTQKLGTLEHVQPPQPRNRQGLVQLCESTIEHLDIFPKAGQAAHDSLFFHMDRTVTAMGARQLRSMLARPLSQRETILERQDAVKNLVEHPSLRQRLKEHLSHVRDVERLLSKVGLHTASPRDLKALEEVFAHLPAIRSALQSHAHASLLQELEIEAFQDLHGELSTRLRDEVPATTREGGLFRSGWHAGLDELISLTDDGKDFLLQLERRERDASGIDSLKVKFNRVFGYYIEVTKTHLSKVPPHYVRKQTTAGGERFITDELKKFEDKILRAEDRRIALEESLFEEILRMIGARSQEILTTAKNLALLDALCSMAWAATENGWCAPEITTDITLEIESGRHPALENLVGRDKFIPNHTRFAQDRLLFLITGPNMSGKSTYMRQVALITLMAHVGSFVPAKSARIGLVDRIATRVGASDRIGRGQSTFMVEMQETAQILNGATSRSLVVLDEIGRGTAT
ncbi:MAG: DNA mismatch repair protein MutS, partial [Bdellovibrionales bacterium]|nr:DNA mismatch repair protein MutS [Bdellovibrionales bacterium]